MTTSRSGTPAASQRGFTLTELMVSLAISALVSIAILGAQGQLTRAFLTQQRVGEAQQGARAGVEVLGRDLRMSGFLISEGLTVALSTEGGVARPLPALAIVNADTTSERSDVITIAYADTSARTTIGAGAGNPYSNATTTVATTAGLVVGDLVAASNQNAACAMKVTGLSATSFDHASSGAPWNTTTNNACAGLAAVWNDGTTELARLVVRRYRIRPADPRGVLEVSPSGGITAGDWVELAQGVIDLQLALRVREPGDTVDLDGDGDPTLDWYSGEGMETALDGSAPLPAPQKAPMALRVSLVTVGGREDATVDTATPELCDPARPDNNALGDRCATAISSFTDTTSRFYRAAYLRKSTQLIDLRNLGTGVGTP